MDRTMAEALNPLIAVSGFSETAGRCAESLNQIATLLNEQHNGNKEVFWLIQAIVAALRFEIDASEAAAATKAAMSRAAR